MTREDAIELIEIAKAEIEWEYPFDYQVAFDKAIKALEQEPCEDAVSRDMALEKMADYVSSGNANSTEDFEEYSKIICQLPSVQPKAGWIPVSEKLPKVGEWVVVEEGTSEEFKWCGSGVLIVKLADGKVKLGEFLIYDSGTTDWETWDVMHGNNLSMGSEVVEWMSFPVPCKESEG